MPLRKNIENGKLNNLYWRVNYSWNVPFSFSVSCTANANYFLGRRISVERGSEESMQIIFHFSFFVFWWHWREWMKTLIVMKINEVENYRENHLDCD